MHTQSEFGVAHLQNVEVVGIFYSLLQCLALFLEVGWVGFALGKKEQMLWYKVWYSSSGGY